MKIYIIGKNGQLGSDIDRELSKNHSCEGGGREYSDITETDKFFHSIKGKYDVIINTSGYVNVPRSEIHPEEAFVMNTVLPSRIAEFCRDNSMKFIHFSTDYVFDGYQKTPYVEEDKPNPVNMYGLSKYAGEIAVLNANPDSAVLRVSGLYGRNVSKGKRTNFPSMIIERCRNGEPFDVVDDQISTPTYTVNVARQMELILKNNISGIVHATDEGAVSWYGFALEIVKIINSKCKIHPVTNIVQEVKRPAYSVLENGVLKKHSINIMKDWHESLKEYLLEQSV